MWFDVETSSELISSSTVQQNNHIFHPINLSVKLSFDLNYDTGQIYEQYIDVQIENGQKVLFLYQVEQ